MTYNGTFSNFCWKFWQLWWIIDQTTDAGLEKSFLSFLSFFTVQFWSAMEFTSHVSLFQKCFYKSPDNNEPRANSRSMSKFVTIANWQICCFIAKFSINRQFCYKLLLGLSWGQSLHQNCKDVKVHITCLIPGLAFISPAIFFTWHNLTCVHWLTPEHTPNTTRFVICWFSKTALVTAVDEDSPVLAVTSGSSSQWGQTTPCCLARHKYVRSELELELTNSPLLSCSP